MSSTRDRTRVNFDLEALRAKLDREDWEDSDDLGRQMRRIYLGSWLSLSPSGKIYAPFACSNVEGCGSCNGTGKIRPQGSRRVVKKLQNRSREVRRLVMKRYGPYYEGNWPAYINKKLNRIERVQHRLADTHCVACGGTGSREAHLDDLWRENMTTAFATKDMCFDEDGEDLFASEYRDIPVETG